MKASERRVALRPMSAPETVSEPPETGDQAEDESELGVVG